MNKIVAPVCEAGYHYVTVLAALYLIAALMGPAAADPIAFNETLPGDRNLNQNFTWTMNNVSMNADSVYHYTVYDYRILDDHYDYWSVNWGQWIAEPAAKGNQYIAVWVRGYLEGTAYHGWGQDRFYVWIGNRSIKAEPVKLQDISIRNIGSYGRDPVVVTQSKCPLTADNDPEITGTVSDKNPASSGRYPPAVIKQLENLKARNERGQLTTERFGWKDENEMDRMEPGYSNRFDGPILFQIPNGTRPEDIRVAGWFGYWGTAVWHLTETEIDQDSTERYIQMESILMDLERETGVRLPDKESGRTEA